MNVVVNVAEGKLVCVVVAQIGPNRLAIDQPPIPLLDRIEGCLKSEIRPQTKSRTVEKLLVLERQIEATDHRRPSNKVNPQHGERPPTEQRAVETTQNSVGIEGLAASHGT